jgi:hypothetical protein
MKGASYHSSLPLKQIYGGITNSIIITDYDTADVINIESMTKNEHNYLRK